MDCYLVVGTTGALSIPEEYQDSSVLLSITERLHHSVGVWNHEGNFPRFWVWYGRPAGAGGET